MTDNVTMLARLYRLWSESKGGSVEDWLAAMDPDVVMGSVAAGAPGMTFTSTRSGRDQARAYFAGLDEDFEMIAFEVTEFIAQDDRVVALIDSTWRSRHDPERVVQVHKADVFRVRDGRILQYFDYFDTSGLRGLA
jgi:ketosteroid isomerase-like protein